MSATDEKSKTPADSGGDGGGNPEAPSDVAAQMLSGRNKKVSEAARDPVRLMMEILENDSPYTESAKIVLIQAVRNRFKNRRLMAYLCLGFILLNGVALLVFAAIDGMSGSAIPVDAAVPGGDAKVGCVGILACVGEYSDLFVWINFFMTSIVGAYFGTSAWRPSS